MEFVEGRSVAIGQKVRVYLNLNRQSHFSIVDRSGSKSATNNKVVAYAENVYLTDCKYIIQRGEQNRVLREKQKNRHAFVDGILTAYESDKPMGLDTVVYYNPYTHPDFTKLSTNEVITASQHAYLANKKVYTE